MTEATRYTNPIKAKFRQKRLAAEGTCTALPHCGRFTYNFTRSGWCWCCTRHKTSTRHDARRVPATKQDPLPAEPTRECHKRPAHGSLLSVRTAMPYLTHMLTSGQISQSVRSSSHPNEERYCFRRVFGRNKRDCCQGCAAQLQAGWRKQDQGNIQIIPV